MTWTGGNSESPLMNPGKACAGCHSGFVIGGTVYPTAHEPDLCMGTNGNATVVITDANGLSVTLPVNGSGNFYGSPVLAFPIRAKVVANGKERAMQTAQMSGNCNGCHTQTGAEMAPGRIVMP
jgi:hypothetical protein